MKHINKIRLIVLLSGFISMELELLGTRLISPIFGPTIYVWTSMIGVTLAFLALGYWYGGKLADKGKININKLGFIVLLLGAYIVLLPFISRLILPQFISLGMILGPLLISLIILAFPIFFLGFIVPTSVKLTTGSLSKVGKKSGEIYALATIGSIIGTFTTGFILILYLGIAKTALLSGLTLIILSLLIIKFNKKIFLILLITSVLLILESQATYPSEILESFDSYHGQIRVIKENDVHMRLYNGAIAMSSVNLETKENEVEYVKYFEIPFIYSPENKKTLMVGLAGGAVARELIDKYDLEMDIVEIEPKMLDLAREYFYWNDEADVYFDDGRHFIKNSNETYDKIILDVGLVFPAWHLYTKEAFEEYEKHLNENGFLVINIIASKEGEYSKTTKSIYNGLNSVFDNILILRNPNVQPETIHSVIFIASKKEINKSKLIHLANSSNYSGLSIKEMVENDYDFKPDTNIKPTTDDFPVAEFYDYKIWKNFGTVSKQKLKYVLP